MRFPTKKCLNGYSVACNRSKEIITRLTSEAIQHMSEIIEYKTPKPFFGLLFGIKNKMVSGPETAAISKSATVRFIIKYVLRLRRWRLLAKTTRVKALIINTMINSVSHTARQMSIVAVIDIL